MIEAFQKEYNNKEMLFKDIFIDIYILGKNSKPEKKDFIVIEKKLKALRKELTMELFNRALNTILEIKIEATKQYSTFYLVDETNETFLRGLLYLVPSLKEQVLYQKIYQLCQKCFSKLSGIGFVSEKLGNACINSLNLAKDIYCVF